MKSEMTNRLSNENSEDAVSAYELSLRENSGEEFSAVPLPGDLLPADQKLSRKVENKSMISLSVYNVGHQHCTPGYAWGPGIRDHYLLHYISSGCGTYETGGNIYHLQKGDAFLAFPNTEIMYRADAADPWTYEWVGFQGTDAGAILRQTDFSESSPVLRNISYGDLLRKRLDAVSNAFGSTFSGSVKMTGELYLLLSVLTENASVSGAAAGAPSHTENVLRAIEFISAKYSYGISVEDIADYVGVSRSTLFREFRRETELSPKEYLDRFRIQRAAALLSGTELKISSVAASVGYENGLYFSKVFRKYTGKSPSQYRG